MNTSSKINSVIGGQSLLKAFALGFALLAGAVVPATATMIFNFADTGAGTTLVTGSGSTTLAGVVSTPYTQFIGWDNGFSGPLEANSSLTAFNVANTTPGFHTYSAALGGTALNVNGVSLSTTQGIWLDGPGAPGSFFVLAFSSALTQSGLVTANGSAIININFSSLPYGAGSTVDIKGDNSVLFTFSAAPVPEGGSTLALAGLALFGLAGLRRKLG